MNEFNFQMCCEKGYEDLYMEDIFKDVQRNIERLRYREGCSYEFCSKDRFYSLEMSSKCYSFFLKQAEENPLNNNKFPNWVTFSIKVIGDVPVFSEDKKVILYKANIIK